MKSRVHSQDSSPRRSPGRVRTATSRIASSLLSLLVVTDRLADRQIANSVAWTVCTGIGCNEALSQIDIKGVGRDIFWPPEVPTRDYTVESIVGPRHLSSYGCAEEYADMGLRGAPMVGSHAMSHQCFFHIPWPLLCPRMNPVYVCNHTGHNFFVVVRGCGLNVGLRCMEWLDDGVLRWSKHLPPYQYRLVERYARSMVRARRIPAEWRHSKSRQRRDGPKYLS